MQKAIRFVAVILSAMMLFGIAACEKGENTEHAHSRRLGNGRNEPLEGV